MTKLLTLLLILGACCAAPRASAQVSAREISGVVRDAATSDPIVGASAIVDGTARGVSADIDGAFSFKNLAAGTYRIRVEMLGYKSWLSDPITLGNDRIELSIALAEEASQVEAVVVVARLPVGTDAGLITRMREAAVVASGISSQQIARTQDKDASEVVRRIPGISVIDDKFVIVRGLAQRYNNTWINGMAVPSSEADSRAFSFDIIPSSQIDNILVVKTPSAEYPADYTGGFVMIDTKTAADRNAVSVSYGTGVNTSTHGHDFRQPLTSPTDFLGFDNGTRDFRNLPARVAWDDMATADRVTRSSFNNDWSIAARRPIPDQKLSASLTRSRTTERGDKLGMALALNYSLTQRTTSDMLNAQYGVYNAAEDRSTARNEYLDDQYTTDVRLGGMANFSLTRTKGERLHTYELRNIFNQLGRNRYTLREGWSNVSGYYEESQEETFYQSRTSYSGQLSGKHTFSPASQLDWNAGYSYSDRRQPDRRIVERTKDPANYDYLYEVRPNYIKRYFTSLDEHALSASADYRRTPGERLTLKAGLLGEQKSRDYSTRYFLYKWLMQNSLPEGFETLPTDQVLAPGNLGAPDKIHIQDETDNTNNYRATNLTAAAYAALEYAVGRLHLYAGLRMEHYHTRVTSYVQVATDKSERHDYTYDNLFPSVNASWDLTERQLLRLSYGRSVNRPEFRELSTSTYYDFEMFSFVMGNQNLKQATIDNYDLRYEFYPASGEVVSVAAFYKRFKNPIEWTYYDMGGAYNYSFTNALAADNYGLEIDVRKRLDFLGAPNLTLTLNASLIESMVRFDDASQDHDRPMQGQSPYLVNAGLFWQNKSGSLSLGALYNRIGERIVGLGRTYTGGGESLNNNVPDMYELPRNAFDLTATLRLNKTFELRAAARDILCEELVFAQYPQFTDAGGKLHERKQITRSLNPGRNFSLSLSANF